MAKKKEAVLDLENAIKFGEEGKGTAGVDEAKILLEQNQEA